MKQTNNKVPVTKTFVINLFGESGTGKTTVLCQLIEMLRCRAKYNLEVAERFQSHDRRAMMWCLSGMQFSGAVSVCTLGDTLKIIQDNVNFFERFFNVPQNKAPWYAWCDAIRGNTPVLKQKEIASTQKSGQILGILVTAARKPLHHYKALKLPSNSIILDVPIRVDAWHNVNDQLGNCDWMSSIFTPPEVLLSIVNYILHNGKLKQYSSNNGTRVSFKSIRSNISRD